MRASQPSTSQPLEAESALGLIIVRERKEHRVFSKLLQMIPGLDERLMRSSEEEVIFIAELVCFRPPVLLRLTSFSDTKRCIQREVRRHQRPQRGHSGLDNPQGGAPQSRIVKERQNRSWLSS
jgi:hypothetical protein